MNTYDEEPEDTNENDNDDENTHSDDWGDAESQEEKGFDDDERD